MEKQWNINSILETFNSFSDKHKKLARMVINDFAEQFLLCHLDKCKEASFINSFYEEISLGMKSPFAISTIYLAENKNEQFLSDFVNIKKMFLDVAVNNFEMSLELLAFEFPFYEFQRAFAEFLPEIEKERKERKAIELDEKMDFFLEENFVKYDEVFKALA